VNILLTLFESADLLESGGGIQREGAMSGDDGLWWKIELIRGPMDGEKEGECVLSGGWCFRFTFCCLRLFVRDYPVVVYRSSFVPPPFFFVKYGVYILYAL